MSRACPAAADHPAPAPAPEPAAPAALERPRSCRPGAHRGERVHALVCAAGAAEADFVEVAKVAVGYEAGLVQRHLQRALHRLVGGHHPVDGRAWRGRARGRKCGLGAGARRRWQRRQQLACQARRGRGRGRRAEEQQRTSELRAHVGDVQRHGALDGLAAGYGLPIRSRLGRAIVARWRPLLRRRICHRHRLRGRHLLLHRLLRVRHRAAPTAPARGERSLALLTALRPVVSRSVLTATGARRSQDRLSGMGSAMHGVQRAREQPAPEQPAGVCRSVRRSTLRDEEPPETQPHAFEESACPRRRRPPPAPQGQEGAGWDIHPIRHSGMLWRWMGSVACSPQRPPAAHLTWKEDCVRLPLGEGVSVQEPGGLPEIGGTSGAAWLHAQGMGGIGCLLNRRRLQALSALVKQRDLDVPDALRSDTQPCLPAAAAGRVHPGHDARVVACGPSRKPGPRKCLGQPRHEAPAKKSSQVARSGRDDRVSRQAPNPLLSHAAANPAQLVPPVVHPQIKPCYYSPASYLAAWNPRREAMLLKAEQSARKALPSPVEC
jgi:hypothetical protein